MYDLEQDEYREKHYGSSGCFYWLVWLVWIVANVAAVAVGQTIIEGAESLVQPQSGGSLLSLQGDVKQTDSLGYFAALLGGVGAGALVGLAQSLVLVPFLKLKASTYWLLATLVGWTIRRMLLFVISQQLLGLVVDRYIEGGCLVLVLLLGIACIAGFATGFPQTLILRPRGYHPMWWLLANLVGPCATAFLITLGLFTEGHNVYRLSSPLLIAVISSIITGRALMDILRHPTSQAEWQPRIKRARERPSRQTEDTVLGSTLYGPVEASTTKSQEPGENQPRSESG